MGELNPKQQFHKPGRNFGILYRYIVNKRYALKAQVHRSTLNATVNDKSAFPIDVDYSPKFPQKVWDFSILTEFNFLTYNTTDLKNRYSPYVTAGISAIMLSNASLNVPLAIPIGFGFKYNYNKRIGIGFEWTFKRTFDDDWDFTHDATTISGKQLAFHYNKDWYSFVGLFLTYKFDESFECPAYD